MKNRKPLEEDRFFSLTFDYLQVYVPSQHSGSGKTRKSYGDALSILRRYVSGQLGVSIADFKFSDCTYDFMLDYRNYLASIYAPRTVNQRVAVVKTYLHYAALRRPQLLQTYLSISDIPPVSVPKVIQPIIEGKDAIHALLSAPSASKKGLRDAVILLVLYDGAIRLDELIRIDMGDLVLNNDFPYVHLHGKGGKERNVSLTKKTVEHIRQYIETYHKEGEQRSTPFIYTVIKGRMARMSERNVERIIKKYADKVRIDFPEIPRHVYPHMLRRTRATGWYRDDVPIETISVLLGHSDAKTTRKHYAFPSVEMLARHVEKGADAEPDAEEPIWKDKEEELARLCGVK